MLRALDFLIHIDTGACTSRYSRVFASCLFSTRIGALSLSTCSSTGTCTCTRSASSSAIGNCGAVATSITTVDVILTMVTG